MPPPSSNGRVDLTALAEQAIQRRTEAGDRDLAMMPDAGDHLNVVAHLLRRRRLEIPADKAAGVLRDDAVDALQMLRGIRDVVDRLELAAINSYITPEVGGQFRGLVEAMGVRTKQAVSQRQKRLAAKLSATDSSEAHRDPAALRRQRDTDQADLDDASVQFQQAQRVVRELIANADSLPAGDPADTLELIEYYAELTSPTGREKAALVGGLRVMLGELAEVDGWRPPPRLAALLNEAARAVIRREAR